MSKDTASEISSDLDGFDDAFSGNFGASDQEQDAPEVEATPEATAGSIDELEQAEQEAASDAPDADDKQQMVPHGALHAEREKRKAAEASAAAVAGKVDQLEQVFQKFLQSQTAAATASEPAPKNPLDGVDFLENPDKAREAVSQAINQSSQSVQSQLDSALQSAGEQFARRQYEDYDTVVASFVEKASNDPALLAQFKAAAPADRAFLAYQQGKTISTLAEAGAQDIGSLLKQTEQAAYEKAKKELAEQMAKATGQPANSDPGKSLGDIPAASGNSANPAPSIEDAFDSAFTGNFA